MNPTSHSDDATRPSAEFQALLDAAVDAVIIIDHVGRIEVFNRSAERLFGYTREEALGSKVGILMRAEERAGHDDFLARYLNERTPHVIGTGREITAQRKDGSIFPAFLSVGIVPNIEPPRYVGLVHEITARQRSAEQELRLHERLTHVSRLATIGEMASGIAHELNQPLAAIATYAHACDRLLSAANPDIEEIQGALRQIAEQAVRAGEIIRRLRGLARDGETHRGPADINEVIAELSQLIHGDATAHGVTYRCELAAGLPRITANRAQIQQVVMNLIRNALEALALGPLAMRELVVRTTLTPGGEVEIRVCDTGPGVATEIADRLFDPFCSTKPTGTGLGLAISRTIVQKHGGTLDHRPNVPTGACFSVRLPAG